VEFFKNLVMTRIISSLARLGTLQTFWYPVGRKSTGKRTLWALTPKYNSHGHERVKGIKLTKRTLHQDTSNITSHSSPPPRPLRLISLIIIILPFSPHTPRRPNRRTSLRPPRPLKITSSVHGNPALDVAIPQERYFPVTIISKAHFALSVLSTAPGQWQWLVRGVPRSRGEIDDAGEHAEIVGAPDGGAVEGEGEG